MEDRDQTNPSQQLYLEFTCPACKRHVRVRREDSGQLPKFFPFCSERCKLIDLGAWLDADYRIASKPEEDSDAPAERASPAAHTDSDQ